MTKRKIESDHMESNIVLPVLLVTAGMVEGGSEIVSRESSLVIVVIKWRLTGEPRVPALFAFDGVLEGNTG